MNYDLALRAAAVVAAFAILAAPYWGSVARAIRATAEAAKPYRADIARFAAACLLIVAAFGLRVPDLSAVSVASLVMLAKEAAGIALIGLAIADGARAVQAVVRATP